MIKDLFIVPLLLVPSMSMGQTNSCSNNWQDLDGKDLEKQEFILPNLENSEVVNLQEASLEGKSQKTKITLACDNPQSFTLVDNANLLNYTVKGDTLFLVGKENHLTRLSYSLPEAIALFPLEKMVNSKAFSVGKAAMLINMTISLRELIKLLGLS